MILQRSLACRTQGDAVQWLANGDKSPECDEQLARQGDDHCFASGATVIGRAGRAPRWRLLGTRSARMASNIWRAGLICVSPASWPDCGKVRSSWTRSGGGIASSVKRCDITCAAGSSNRPFDSTPPEPQSPVVPSHVTQQTAQPTAGFRLTVVRD